MAHVEADLRILYVGTPVVLVSTSSAGGSFNIGPMSSAWALGDRFMLGLGCDGQTFENLEATGECVLNFPHHGLWESVEKLAKTTGKNPVPEAKKSKYRFEADKFSLGHFTAVPSSHVSPPRIAQCPIQMEAVLVQSIPIAQEVPGDPPDAVALEVRVVKTWVDESILEDASHICPKKWSPLIYNFRHYFGLGTELGKTFKSET